MKLVPVILSGGAGTRLWPVSRRHYPKPFLSVGGKSLLGHTVARAGAVGSERPVIVTNEALEFLSKSLVPEHCDYLLEPEGRNTAPAIAIAAIFCAEKYGSDAVMIIMPADHIIHNMEAFVADAEVAARVALDGQLVVFGISPTAPDTGYGYVEVHAVADKVQPVKSFVEKPDYPTACDYLASGRYYWNSGMFCFRADAILRALETSAPDVWQAAHQCFAKRQSGADVTFDLDLFRAQPNISIDYAVMEKADNVSVVPAHFAWSDVGTWDSLAQALPQDEHGNSRDGDALMEIHQSEDTHISGYSGSKKLIAALGTKSLVIVDTPDALLVADKSKAKDVKVIVEQLIAAPEDSLLHQLSQFASSVYRPWGHYTSLREDKGYQVKRIVVYPGQKLSLQYHHHRAEHWVVVSGMARVQIDEVQHDAGAGSYFFIPQGAQHRLSNIGDEDMCLIEVQVGDYLGEDDIVRLDDDYGRVDAKS